MTALWDVVGTCWRMCHVVGCCLRICCSFEAIAGPSRACEARCGADSRPGVGNNSRSTHCVVVLA
jgi:hypothetical protein